MRRARFFVLAIVATAASCGGGSDSLVGPASGTVTLRDVQAQVLTPRCAIPGCHVAGSAAFGLDMSSVTQSSAHLIGIPSSERPELNRVTPGDSANSYVYWKLSGNPYIGGDRMPLTGGPLSDGDIALVAAWIDGGAK